MKAEQIDRFVVAFDILAVPAQHVELVA